MYRMNPLYTLSLQNVTCQLSQQKQSNKKKKSTRIYSPGSYIKTEMLQVSNGLLRYNKNLEITDR